MSKPIVDEPSVLRATTAYLASRNALPYRFSLPSGKGIDSSAVRANLVEFFGGFDIEPEFVASGPDIVAVSGAEYWLVECKGSGSGKAQTQRNNFDRALASVVSYYEDQPTDVPDAYRQAKVFLGLALPDTEAYLREIRRRVRTPLRRKLNLWILLYRCTSGKMTAFPPSDDGIA